MAVYLALFAVMWKYAPADEEEEDEEVQQEGGWCPLLSGGETSAQAGAVVMFFIFMPRFQFSIRFHFQNNFGMKISHLLSSSLPSANIQ